MRTSLVIEKGSYAMASSECEVLSIEMFIELHLVYINVPLLI